MKFKKVDLGLGDSVWVKDGGNYTDLVMINPVLKKNTNSKGSPKYFLDSFINRGANSWADWALDEVEWRGDDVVLHRSGDNGVVVLAKLTDEVLVERVLPILDVRVNIKTVEEFRKLLGFSVEEKA